MLGLAVEFAEFRAEVRATSRMIYSIRSR